MERLCKLSLLYDQIFSATVLIKIIMKYKKAFAYDKIMPLESWLYIVDMLKMLYYLKIKRFCV